MKPLSIARRARIAAVARLAAYAAVAIFADPTLAQTAPVVQTTKGAVAGLPEGTTFAYKGIPYGADTSGANRFLPAVEPAAWTGVFSATSFGPACPQHSTFIDGRPYSEDCLKLNVWTPSVTQKRPVIVWFHGGAFKLGTDNYVAEGTNGAAAAANHNAVFVSMTHRLNTFGFLQLGKEFGHKYASSGNVGMLDLAAALEWVKKNIAQFGGDPDNITISGVSGGGAKTMHALAMPAFRGLFQHAILNSGHDLWKRNSYESALKSSRAVLDAAGIAPGDIQALRNVPMETLLNAHDAVSTTYPADPSWGAPGWVKYDILSPTIDGATLPMYPMDAVAFGASAHVDLAIGINEWDHWNPTGAINYGRMTEADLVEALIPFLFDDSQRIVDAYQKIAPGASPSSLLAMIVTDRDWWVPALNLAEAKYAGGGKPAYVYYNLNGTGGHRFVNGGGGQTPSGTAMVGEIEGVFANFAATGSPNIASDTVPKWLTYKPDTRRVMAFQHNNKVPSDPSAARREVWKNQRPGPAGFGQ